MCAMGTWVHAGIGVRAWVCMGVGNVGDVRVWAMGMHVSPASEMLTLDPQRVEPIHLSIFSSNIFYFSEEPSRELGTNRCPRKTGVLLSQLSLTAVPKQVTKPSPLCSNLLSH